MDGSLSIWSLVSDGFKRLAYWRAPSDAAADAVIWLHGGNGIAKDFLAAIRPRAGIVDVAPQGLETGGHPGWVNPWESGTDLPAGVRDSLIDVRFVAALESHVRRSLKSVKRVWLCGFSAGGGLVWAIWALRSTVPNAFAGFGAAGKKLRREIAVGRPWDPRAVAPLPFVMVNGTLDDPDDPAQPSGTHYSWEESYAQARAVNGNTSNVAMPARHAACCDPAQLVRLKVAGGGVAPSARYVVEQAGHTWLACDTCHTDDFFIEQFKACGLGAA